MMSYAKVFLLTLLPFLELRYSIPIGIYDSQVHLPFGFILKGYGLSVISVFTIAIIANILLAIILFPFLDYIHKILLKIKFINSMYERKLQRLQAKLRPRVEKYGLLGLALFIAVPLPGSGVYSGSLGAYVLGMDYKRFIYASIIGVLIAGSIVTFLSVIAL